MPRFVQIETCFFWDNSLYLRIDTKKMHSHNSTKMGGGPVDYKKKINKKWFDIILKSKNM